MLQIKGRKIDTAQAGFNSWTIWITILEGYIAKCCNAEYRIHQIGEGRQGDLKQMLSQLDIILNLVKFYLHKIFWDISRYT